MRETVRFGKVAGIPVGAHWSVLVVLLLVAEGMAMVDRSLFRVSRRWPTGLPDCSPR